MAVALVDDLKVHWYLEPAEIAELNGQFDPDQKGIVWFYTLLNTMVGSPDKMGVPRSSPRLTAVLAIPAPAQDG